MRKETFLRLLLLALLVASPLALADAPAPAVGTDHAVQPADGADLGVTSAELGLDAPEPLAMSGCTAELTCPTDGTVITCSGSWQCYRANVSVVCDSHVTYCPGLFGGGPGGGGPIPQQ